ncbi:transglycosylase family protein [Pseudonocardia sp. MCCB 268]|nr:transglycosylase family protein [Pseudonocardia cytotoxica]
MEVALAGSRALRRSRRNRPVRAAARVSSHAIRRQASGGGDRCAGGTDTATWDKLAECESGGDWSTNTGNGYQGGLQFSPAYLG